MLGRIVAVKVLSGERTDEETLKRFKNEAPDAARLDHENIARVHYVGEDRGWNYIVFEYIEGLNLRELVEQKGPLPLAEAVSYTLQVAEALDHAARRDVIHRDIKPSNVLVTPGGRAKLVDMGLARFYQVESSQADLTASGVTLGTFDYISPEQARDPRNTDVRSDLYSLGCTLYYMLTGLPPFPEGTVLQKLLSHTSDEPPDPRFYRPELSEEVTAIVGKLLAKDPADRYQEPNQLIGQLLLLSEQLGLPNVGRLGAVWIAPDDTPNSFLERHLPWAAPAIALLAAVFFVYLFSSPSGSLETQQAELDFGRSSVASRPATAKGPAEMPARPRVLNQEAAAERPTAADFPPQPKPLEAPAAGQASSEKTPPASPAGASP